MPRATSNNTGGARIVFIKDTKLSVEGLSLEEAERVASGIDDEGGTLRVRVRMRTRTGMWDVVVKRPRP